MLLGGRSEINLGLTLFWLQDYFLCTILCFVVLGIDLRFFALTFVYSGFVAVVH